MLRLVLILSLAVASQSVLAKTYRWTDEKGEVHYGDTLPPQAAKGGSSEISKSGHETTRPAAMSEEEFRKQEAERKAKEAAAVDDKEQRRRDRALLDSYTSEEEIDMARDRNLQATKVSIESTQVRLKSAEARLATVQKQVDTIASHKSPIPEDVAKNRVTAENEVKSLKQSIQKYQDEMAAIRAKFEGDKARFRALRGGGQLAR